MEENIEKEFYGMFIPEHMQEGILAYINKGQPTGSFLESIITNNLREAVANADDQNIHNIPAFVNFFYNYSPGDCWGSVAKYDKWVSHKGLKKMQR